MAMKPSRQSAHNAHQRDYYDRRSVRENRRIAVTSSPYIQNHIEKFLAFSQLTVGEEILDVGCGMGKYTLPLAELGHSIEGLDLSPGLLQAFASEAADRDQVALHCGDILNPSPELLGRFDVLTGFFMLHHLFDIDKAWLQFRRLLKPGGRVVFLDVNPWCPLFYLQIAITPGMSWRAERGILNLTESKLHSAASRAGFSGYRSSRFGILPPFVRNRPAGGALEALFDKTAIFHPVAAFQLLGARLPAGRPKA